MARMSNVPVTVVGKPEDAITLVKLPLLIEEYLLSVGILTWNEAVEALKASQSPDQTDMDFKYRHPRMLGLSNLTEEALYAYCPEGWTAKGLLAPQNGLVKMLKMPKIESPIKVSWR
jgi:hypothetical protein